MLCSRVQNLLSAYCDLELTGAEMIRIRAHLDRCPSCGAELAELRAVKNLLGAMPAVEPERPFQPEALAGPSRLAFPLAARVRAFLGSGLNALLACLARPVPTPYAAGAIVLAIGVVSAGILARPQHPDAVAANVPVATMEAMPLQPPPALLVHADPLEIEASRIEPRPVVVIGPNGPVLVGWERPSSYPHLHAVGRHRTPGAAFLANYGR
jgi:anti-sigma factor RsiW